MVCKRRYVIKKRKQPNKLTKREAVRKGQLPSAVPTYEHPTSITLYALCCSADNLTRKQKTFHNHPGGCKLAKGIPRQSLVFQPILYEHVVNPRPHALKYQVLVGVVLVATAHCLFARIPIFFQTFHFCREVHLFSQKIKTNPHYSGSSIRVLS